MNKIKQRVKIAELCGWTNIHNVDGKLWGIIPYAEEFDSQGALENSYEIPNYPDKLDDMHEAENILNAYQKHKYTLLVRGDYASVESMWILLSDTAAQRAEAFLKTFNLWEENE